MPWKESSAIEGSSRFVARLLEAEERRFPYGGFGFSRKTGYKISERYKDCGIAALSDRSRVKIRFGNQFPFQPEVRIVRPKRSIPHVPGMDTKNLEPATGLEPATRCLQNSCSTTELRRRTVYCTEYG